MKRLTVLVAAVLLVAVSVCYAEREDEETHRIVARERSSVTERTTDQSRDGQTQATTQVQQAGTLARQPREMKQLKFKTTKMKTTMPQFKTTTFRNRDFSSNAGNSERNIQSTGSAMSNMRVRYMNRIAQGSLDYVVNQGGSH